MSRFKRRKTGIPKNDPRLIHTNEMELTVASRSKSILFYVNNVKYIYSKSLGLSKYLQNASNIRLLGALLPKF